MKSSLSVCPFVEAARQLHIGAGTLRDSPKISANRQAQVSLQWLVVSIEPFASSTITVMATDSISPWKSSLIFHRPVWWF